MKRSNIIIGILVVLAIVLSLFSYAQKIRAEQTEILAIEQREIAEMSTLQAEMNLDSLKVAQARCEVLQKLLEDCKTKE